MQRVTCVGSVSQDIFFPTDEGIILKTPQDVTAQVKIAFELGGKFRVQDRFESLGGVAGNVAVGLTRLGIETHCYSCIGSDELGRHIRQMLEQEGVNAELIQVIPKVQSDLSAIIVATQTGDRIIFHNRDANEHLTIQPNLLQDTDWLYISALNGPWKQNMLSLRQAAQTAGIKLALNPGQHNLKDDPQLMLDTIRHTQALFLNKDEAVELLLTNKLETSERRLNDEVALVQQLSSEGPAVVAVTDGRRGAWASDGRALWHAQSYEPHGLKDTTGGGDAFGSGFFAAYLKGFALETCLRYGICNAGNVVGYYGAIQGLLDEATMQSHLAAVQTTRLV